MAKHRGSGEGTITQLPSGRWRAQVSVGGKRIGETFDSQREAQRWIREKSGQIEAGLSYDSAKTSLETFITGWLAQKKTRLRPATSEQYERMARLYILPSLGRVKLGQLTPGKIQAFYDQLQDQETGERTIQVVHAVLHGCLEQAWRLGLVARNPSDVCIVPKWESGEMQIWTESQVSQFLVSIIGERNEHLFALELATGMRRGELIGLQWGDINWSAKMISVVRQVYEPAGGGWVYQEPKTDRGRRSIQLGDNLMDRLREQAAKADRQRQAVGERWQEHDLIFPSSVGTPQNGYNLSKEFKRLSARAGLPAIRFHDMRHTAASIMLSHRMAPVIVAGYLGHSLDVLLTRYAHFIPSQQEPLADLMDQITTPVSVDISVK